MNSLTIAPVAPLIEKLFQESEATPDEVSSRFSQLSIEERERLMRSKTEYRTLYGHLNTMALPVSRNTGVLLYLLARSCKARNIIEFGTSFGVSTLHLAAALQDNGGGRLITTEFEPGKLARARSNLAAGGLDRFVEFRDGDALQTLASDLPEHIDLVLLDGAKALYPDILDLLEPRLRAGALIIADNADASPEYVARVRAADRGYLSIPFADDVELSMRLG